MFDDPALDGGSGVLIPPESDDVLGVGESAALDEPAGPDGPVLRFPVEIEVRLVAPFDPEHLVGVALDRLTAALQGLA